MAYDQSRTIPIHRYRNVLWPVQRNSKGWALGTIGERLGSALHHLLRTPKGTYLWEPEYGLALDRYRTQGISEDTADIIRTEALQAVRRWLPEIVLLKFDPVYSQVGDETLKVLVGWGISEALLQPYSDQRQTKLIYGPINEEVTI